MPAKKPNWTQLKAVLSQQKPAEVLKLVADLYRFSKDNRAFIESRLLSDTANLEHYKKIISAALYPDVYKNRPVRLSVGKKAISDYRKASNDSAGTLELMMYYLEQGNAFTANFGDIDAPFYNSLCSMLDRILAALEHQTSTVQDQYIPRLEEVVARSSNIGWGYHDYLSDQVGQFLLDYGDDR